jgi:peptidoglycan hydrolase-like protein with peptidoglycan-binding domain
MDWQEAAHPRAPAGPGGGEFAQSKGSAPAKKGKAPRSKGGSGSLSFNGRTGTGYGKKGGDSRVKALQTALNKLGLKDANGKPLAIDGMLGPKTTAAIKAWQKKNGMKPSGSITASDLHKLTTAKAKPRTSTAHLAKKRPAARRPAAHKK